MSGVSIHPDQNHVIQGRFPVVAPLIQQLTRFAWLLQRCTDAVRARLDRQVEGHLDSEGGSDRQGNVAPRPSTPLPPSFWFHRGGCLTLSLYPPLTSDGGFTRKIFFGTRVEKN
jgi:hypothetical protein